MRNAVAICVVALLCCSCQTTSNVDEVDWDTVLEKAELAVEMAHEVYALWDLAHELIGTPEEVIASKRSAFQARIAETEKYLNYVRNLLDGKK